MLVVETVVRIRREHAGGKPIKAIARDLRLSRKVVRKAIRAPEGAFDYRRAVQPLPRIGPFQERLDALLVENEARHRRDRLRMTRIHDLLLREGFEGSYDAVRRYARRWSDARRKDPGDGTPVFIPLLFRPGEAYQFDWSHEDVEIAGKPMRVKVAHTGAFSFHVAALEFVWLAGGSIAVGTGLTWLIAFAKNWISHRLGEDSGSQIIISLLMPFAAYLLAERLHCSGVLASVAAGLTMGVVEGGGQALAVTRLRRSTVWDVIQFAVNGIIFVLLGEQLPLIVSGASRTVRLTGHSQPIWLVLYVLSIMVGLAVIRFAWVWTSLQLTLFRQKEFRSAPDWRIVATMSFAGVRGAITLAGILTLPLTMTDGSPFPGRDLAIFLAMGVIVTSLAVASIALPLLLKGLTMPPEPSHQAEEDSARIATARAAIAEIERVQHESAEGRDDADRYVAAASTVMATYRHRIENRQGNSKDNASGRLSERIERDFRLAALKAERAEVLRMMRTRKLDSALARKMIRELDLLETRYAG